MNARTATFLDRIRRYASSPGAVVRTLRLIAQDRTVRRSPLFDRDWYLRETPELAASGESPSLHYLACGAAAGKDPGPGFCGAEYLALHPDARSSGLNPLVHFERIGRRRGYRISFLQPEGPAGETWRFPSLEEHQAAFPAKVSAIRSKAARGERIRAVFFVANASMFPARALLDAMRRDPRFEARIAVVPDMRGIGGSDPSQAMERCLADLAANYPPDAFLSIFRRPDGQWPDILAEFGADIVCHPSPYDLSDFRYNPRWCVGRPILPIYVNYGYPCTAFALPVLGLSNYAYLWKVFLEGDDSLEAYRSVSPMAGCNGVVVGDVKMDALASATRHSSPRKRVLVCPHHSVEGGANNLLALSNFLRYADFFADLPARFPELDFLFRPHPFLFSVLAHPKFWGPAKCAAWRERFLMHPNAAWSQGGDAVADFAASDAIIQDCSSFLAEWMFTGRPCCYMLKSKDDVAKFLPVGRECLRHCTVAFDAATIDTFLRDVVLGGRDDLATARETFRRSIAVNWPHATDAALNAIRRELLPACQPLPSTGVCGPDTPLLQGAQPVC